MSICACLHADGMVHVCLFIPHKLLTDGDVQEVAKFNVNPDIRKSISKNVFHMSNFIVAELRLWRLWSVLFQWIETNKGVFMKALLTDRVASLLWGVKPATDGDLWPLF